MTEPGNILLEVALGDERVLGSIHVELAAYCDFDAWIEVSTEGLVARWASLAAPRASRARAAPTQIGLD